MADFCIYSVDKNGNVKLAKEAIQLCTDLIDLSKEELLYIIYVYDLVGSPLKQHVIEERKRIAKRIIWKNDEVDPEKDQKINDAIDSYRSLIYDSRLEYIDVLKRKISQVINDIENDEDYSKAKDYDKAMEIYQKRIDALQLELQKEEDKMILRGGNKLSLLERLRRNKRLWEINKPK